MKEIISTCIKEYFDILSQVMTAKKIELCDLDSELGDGDIGLTMSKGFDAVRKELKNIDEEESGNILLTCSKVLMNTVPSTMGTLLASGFLRAGKAALGKKNLTHSDLILVFKQFIEGIEVRGKAKRGDKTILESLYPAVDVLEQTMEFSFLEMASAAKEGYISTKDMVSKHGRASRYLDESIGHYDAGAAVGYLLIEGLSITVGKSSLEKINL